MEMYCVLGISRPRLKQIKIMTNPALDLRFLKGIRIVDQVNRAILLYKEKYLCSGLHYLAFRASFWLNTV